MQQTARDQQLHGTMASDLEKKVANELSTVEKMSKYDFEPYWPAKKLRICITGKLQQPTRVLVELFLHSTMLGTLCVNAMMSALLCEETVQHCTGGSMPDWCSCKIAAWLLMHRCKHRSLLRKAASQNITCTWHGQFLTGQYQPWVLSASALVMMLSAFRWGMQQAGAEVSCDLVFQVPEASLPPIWPSG